MKKTTFLIFASLYALGASAQTTSNSHLPSQSTKTPLELATCITQNWADFKQGPVIRKNLEANDRAFEISYLNGNQVVVDAVVKSNENKHLNSLLFLKINKNNSADQNVIDLARNCL